ncbi:MAG TPA: hypothetical protein VFM74_08685 [Candidatus Limnocylindria bacterium]|nr:hypothetical protein [Candidatus Limnocylindria bacterium]
MPDPIIYVDQSDVVADKLPQLEAAIRELADLVERTQPQLLAYRAHFSRDGRRMTIIHIHRDAGSLDTFTEAAGPAFGRFRDLVRLRRIDVYGQAAEPALERLRDKARLLAGDGSPAVVEVHRSEAGFSRLR